MQSCNRCTARTSVKARFRDSVIQMLNMYDTLDFKQHEFHMETVKDHMSISTHVNYIFAAYQMCIESVLGGLGAGTRHGGGPGLLASLSVCF
jgi:hypothetical protein